MGIIIVLMSNTFTVEKNDTALLIRKNMFKNNMK